MELVKNELLRIQEQSANELGRYEQTMKQMAKDQTSDLKKERKFIKELVSEISDIETIIAASQLSSQENSLNIKENANFEEIQRGKLACRFN